MSAFTYFSTLVVLLILLPDSNAHMALRHPSAYGYNDVNLQKPLASKSFADWWFHGHVADKPAEVMSIPAGKTLTVQIACSNTYSTYGAKPNTDACMNDSGAYHAGGKTNNQTGWQGNIESSLTGCALAIAPRTSAGSTNPADFTIMSIQSNCVRQRDTTFAIPSNLPVCPGGECTCAWFWQEKNSAAEMYMVGFRCKVEGGALRAFPVPVKPKKGGSRSVATQPFYWANNNTNIDYTPTYDTRPTYNSKSGWVDGAQTAAFGLRIIASPSTI